MRVMILCVYLHTYKLLGLPAGVHIICIYSSVHHILVVPHCLVLFKLYFSRSETIRMTWAEIIFIDCGWLHTFEVTGEAVTLHCFANWPQIASWLYICQCLTLWSFYGVYGLCVDSGQGSWPVNTPCTIDVYCTVILLSRI